MLTVTPDPNRLDGGLVRRHLNQAGQVRHLNESRLVRASGCFARMPYRYCLDGGLGVYFAPPKSYLLSLSLGFRRMASPLLIN